MTYGAVAANEGQLAGATASDNRMVWNGTDRGRYEVWYLTGNHRASQTGFWIRYTLESPKDGHGEPYAQLWFALFDAADPTKNFALNQRLPISALVATRDPFEVRLGGARLAHDGMRGELAGHGHTARWDLGWLPSPTTHHQLPGLVYRTTFADTVVLTPNLDVPLRGWIEVDGRRLELDGEPGGQTHLWGRKHAHAWAWGHCNAFEGRRGAAFEALAVRLKRRGVVLPTLTMLTLYLDGEAHRFTEFTDLPMTRARFGTARFSFSATGARTKLEGEYTCRPEDLITAEYADPDGDHCYCANTEVADLRITVWRRSGLRWREQTRLWAPKTGHFEVGGREPDPQVAARHVTI